MHITKLPVAPLILEVRSERFTDILRALNKAGFVLSNAGHTNRFRIEDDLDFASLRLQMERALEKL